MSNFGFMTEQSLIDGAIDHLVNPMLKAQKEGKTLMPFYCPTCEQVYITSKCMYCGGDE